MMLWVNYGSMSDAAKATSNTMMLLLSGFAGLGRGYVFVESNDWRRAELRTKNVLKPKAEPEWRLQ